MMRLGPTATDQQPDYFMKSDKDRVALAWSDSEKDLGVLVDCGLTFSDELKSRIKKANTVMGVIRRTFTYLDERVFLCLYKALVCPHMEYACSVWSPQWKKR